MVVEIRFMEDSQVISTMIDSDKPHGRLTQPKLARIQIGLLREPRILIAEHRDEIFARLACDLTEIGASVFRAMRARDIDRKCKNTPAAFVLGSMRLPDADIWPILAKLKAAYPRVRIWLYSAREAAGDRAWAVSCNVERIFYYEGDLLALSSAIKWHADTIRKEFSQSAAENVPYNIHYSSGWDRP